MLHVADPNALLAEADQISRALAACESYKKTLDNHLAEVLARLDVLTVPSVKPQINDQITVRRGFSCLGESRRCSTYLSIYTGILYRLWKAFPEKREAMAKAVSRTAYTRRYVAQERKRLFLGMPEQWTLKHSTELCDGWYVDLNVNRKTIHQILSRAVAAAGLKWGEDVRVTWDTQLAKKVAP